MLPMKIKTHILLLLILATVVNSCKKSDETTNIPVTESTLTTSISGIIKNESGQPLAGINVSVGNLSTTTDISGLFNFNNITVNSSRCLIKCQRTGLIDQYYGLIPFSNEITYANIIMMTAEGIDNFHSSTGGLFSLPDGSSAAFPANAIAREDGSQYNGNVTIHLKYINVDDTDFTKKIPGNDLLAIDKTSASKILYSYGMMNVELTGSTGEKLNLAGGKTAELKFPVSSTQNAAPVTIPVWYFDTVKGIWKEEGSATKSGNEYIFNVNHFSWWNCDVPSAMATIKGKVTSCSGILMPNTAVIANGINSVYTNSLGEYQGLIPANISTPVYAVNNNQEVTQTEMTPFLSAGSIGIMPDLVFASLSNTLTISGIIADCDNSPMSGLAVITGPQGFWSSQYTGNNGVFSFNVNSGSTYTITVSVNGLSNQYTVSPTAAGLCDEFEIGLLPLCQGSSSGNGNFSATVITTQFGNQVYNFNANHCTVTTDTDIPASTIEITSFDSTTSFTNTFEIINSDYIPGNYTWNSLNNYLHFNMMMFGFPVEVTADLSNGGGNSLNSAPAPGNDVEGSYSGSVIITSPQLPGGQITGYITGNFAVFRNN